MMGSRSGGTTYLSHHIPHLVLDFLLRHQEPLPQLIAHAPFLEEGGQSLLRASDCQHAVDVFGCAPQQRRPQDALGYGGRFLVAGAGLGLEVQEREVDVALEVGWEPGFEGGCLD